MSMSASVREYLEHMDIDYDVLHHNPTRTSMMSAEQCNISGEQLAKAVILCDENGFIMAILPSTHRLDLGQLQQRFHRPLGLATENELSGLFDDCAPGAVPPLSEIYGLDCIVDDSLTACDEVYFEAGDHEDIVRISGRDFRDLTTYAQHGHFSHHI